MTCVKCKHQYCYVCLQTYKTNHFNSMNKDFYKCAAPQFGDVDEAEAIQKLERQVKKAPCTVLKNIFRAAVECPGKLI